MRRAEQQRQTYCHRVRRRDSDSVAGSQWQNALFLSGSQQPGQKRGLVRDGEHLVTASGWAAILWETFSGKKLQTFRDYAQSATLSCDGNRVFTLFNEKAIQWDASGRKLQTFEGHTSQVSDMALGGDGKHFVTGSKDKTAILWEAAGGKKLQTFAGHSEPVTCVGLSSDC